jgi:hypothetical protein
MAALALSPPARRQDNTVDLTAGGVFGAPKTLLRLEGFGVLALAAFAYSQVGAGWALFAILFLVPDLSMLGYLSGPRVGALFYNLGHSYLLPAALGVAGFVIAAPLLTSTALIWVAHIGFDRLIGYGFKYADAFKHTHLGLPFAKAA